MLFDPTVLFHFLSLTSVVAAIKIMAACVNDRRTRRSDLNGMSSPAAVMRCAGR
jgi:hypothetical protein